jgi:TRAP-type C4-dicarboxylate transport system permease large subunit
MNYLVIPLLIVLAPSSEMPLFVILGGGRWSRSSFRDFVERGSDGDEQARHLPILLSIPMFTFAGYLFAESRMPERLVRLTRSFFGWIPGSLALVAMVACAVFTAFTGGSGVTIVAMGGLLMPALAKEGFSRKYSLGLMTTSGSLGFLFPPSLGLIIYSYVASQSASAMVLPEDDPGIDRPFLAGLLPGIFLILVLSFLAFREGAKTAGRDLVPGGLRFACAGPAEVCRS